MRILRMTLATTILAVGLSCPALSQKSDSLNEGASPSSSAVGPLFPELEGEPVAGEWYGIYPEGAKSALGEPYHGLFKLGMSGNVMVLFNGGGVNYSAETSSKTSRSFNVETGGDMLALMGLGGGETSPFHDWTVVNLPYSTGDFHIGSGTFSFEEENGEPSVIHHAGYVNFELVMAEVLPFIRETDKLLVSGYSAGGFGSALLADRVMSYFPQVDNVTVAVDSALIKNKNWHDIAVNVWKAPAEISDRLVTDNITLDALTALVERHPDVKILFSSSPRDDALVENQAFAETGEFRKTAEGGKQYQRDLVLFIRQLWELTPNSAFYIFPGAQDELGLTTHTMLLLTSFLPLQQVTPAQWIHDAVEGNLKDYGLNLLEP